MGYSRLVMQVREGFEVETVEKLDGRRPRGRFGLKSRGEEDEVLQLVVSTENIDCYCRGIQTLQVMMIVKSQGGIGSLSSGSRRAEKVQCIIIGYLKPGSTDLGRS